MYRVDWLNAVADELARIYTEAFEQGGDTAAITRAAAQVDRLLGGNPSDQGESREYPRRVLIVTPLTVTFEVVEDDRLVIVLDIIHHRH